MSFNFFSSIKRFNEMKTHYRNNPKTKSRHLTCDGGHTFFQAILCTPSIIGIKPLRLVPQQNTLHSLNVIFHDNLIGSSMFRILIYVHSVGECVAFMDTFLFSYCTFSYCFLYFTYIFFLNYLIEYISSFLLKGRLFKSRCIN